jgi:hypothetical protein
MGGISISAAGDVQAIGEVLRRLDNLFSKRLPTSKELADSGVFDTSDGFILDGESFQQFADEISSDLDLVGASFTSWSLTQFNPGTLAIANVKTKYKNLSDFAIESDLFVFKKIAGNWVISGNGQLAKINFYNENMLSLSVNNQLVNTAEPRIRNGIRFLVVPFAYNNNAKNNSRIASAEISGTGLTKPLQLITGNSEYMGILGPALTDGNAFWDCASANVLEVSLPCLDLLKVKSMEPYSIILKDEQGNPLNEAAYKILIHGQPKVFTELSANIFVKINSIKINGSPITSTSFGPNQSLRIDFNVPDGLQISDVYFAASSTNGRINEQYILPKGATSAVFGWGDIFKNTTVPGVYIRIEAHDRNGIKHVTGISVKL